MNNKRRIVVLRSLLCDFFFVLRRAIVVPPAIQGNKERPRLVELEEARQSPNNSNEPGRKKRSEPMHCCSIKTGGFF